MTSVKEHTIGTPGIPWGSEEKTIWLAQQTIKRSYQQQVVSRIEAVSYTHLTLPTNREV